MTKVTKSRGRALNDFFGVAEGVAHSAGKAWAPIVRRARVTVKAFGQRRRSFMALIIVALGPELKLDFC